MRVDYRPMAGTSLVVAVYMGLYTFVEKTYTTMFILMIVFAGLSVLTSIIGLFCKIKIAWSMACTITAAARMGLSVACLVCAASNDFGWLLGVVLVCIELLVWVPITLFMICEKRRDVGTLYAVLD